MKNVPADALLSEWPNVPDGSDDMLIIRGVNLFPSQVETVLLEMSETKPHYRIVVDRINNLDMLTMEVEVEEKFFLDKISQLTDGQAKDTE